MKNSYIFLLILILGCSNEQSNIDNSINKKKLMKDSVSFLFNKFNIPDSSVCINLNNEKFIITKGLLYKQIYNEKTDTISDDFLWDITLLNYYVEPNGLKNYIKSGFWSQNEDNNIYQRNTPDSIDIFLQCSDIYFENRNIDTSQILNLKISIQFVSSKSQNCTLPMSPKFSEIICFAETKVNFKNLLDYGVIMKSFPLEKFLTMSKIKENKLYLNQIIVLVTFKFDTWKDSGCFFYIQPVCSDYSTGEEIINKLDSFETQKVNR